MKTAGIVLDFYDDRGALLTQLVDQDAVPDFVKQASVVPPEAQSSLPNESFALAATDGGHLIRKYATVDPGNVWLSTQYFLAQRGYLPKLAQVKAAGNLLAAHDRFDMAPPAPLVKVALDQNVDEGFSMGAVVDTTGHVPAPSIQKEAVPEDLLALGEYPVDTYEHVKVAHAYFAENLTALHPRQRRQFAQKLAERSADLGVPVDPDVTKYAGAGFAPDAETFIRQRAEFLPEARRPALDEFVEAVKTAAAAPEVVAAALCAFDETTGVAHLWDHHVTDPYYSVIGHIKEAEWDWAEGAERVTESDLKALAINNRGRVIASFGEDFANQLAKDPVSVFKSLPDTTKVLLARMGSDSGTPPDQG